MRKSQNNVITNIKMIEIIEVSLEALMHVDSPDGALTLLTALEVEAQEYLCSNDAFDQLTTWRHECTMLCQAHEDSSYADMKLIHMLQEKNEFLQLWIFKNDFPKHVRNAIERVHEYVSSMRWSDN